MKILKTLTSLLCAFTLTLTSTPLTQTIAASTDNAEEHLIYETTEILKSRPLEYEYWESGAGVWTIEYTIKAYDTGHIHIDAKILDSSNAIADDKYKHNSIDFLYITLPRLRTVVRGNEAKLGWGHGGIGHTMINPHLNGETLILRGTTKTFEEFSYDYYIREELLYTNQTITLVELVKGVPDFDWDTYYWSSCELYDADGYRKRHGSNLPDFYNAPYTYYDSNTHARIYDSQIEWLNNNISTIEHPITIPFENKLGDINNDNTITVADLVLLQKWLLAVPNTELPNWRAADLCKDNKLDVFDACLLRRKLIEHATQ